MFRLVLGPRSPPPQPNPWAANGDGVPPPPPLPVSQVHIVLVISFSGSTDEEGVMADADGEGAMTARDVEGLMTTAGHPVILAAGDEGQAQALTTRTSATIQTRLQSR
jgi:hypothetical protein